MCGAVLISLGAAVKPAPRRKPATSAIMSPHGTGTVGPGASGAMVVRAQILLDRAHFSPGEIDGAYGEDLGVAIKGYQSKHGLDSTGIIDAGMWQALDTDSGPLLIPYVLTQADERGPFQPIPADTLEKAKLKRLGYETPEEGLGEKFHSSPKLLKDLNPDRKLDVAGTQIMVPNVRHAAAGRGLRVVGSKSKRTVVVYGASGRAGGGAGDRILAEYPATMGDVHDPLPIGSWKVTAIVQEPWFNYDPDIFWNPDPKKARAVLPPGPNSPAGTVWIGLSREHYGIHGTPDPSQIHHDVSAGCIRLTNWDVEELSHLIRPGTPVILEE